MPAYMWREKLNTITRGGKQSSAARRGTEKPPWVLVSEAVRVLQNMWGVDEFAATSTSSSSPSTSTSPSCSFCSNCCVKWQFMQNKNHPLELQHESKEGMKKYTFTHEVNHMTSFKFSRTQEKKNKEMPNSKNFNASFGCWWYQMENGNDAIRKFHVSKLERSYLSFLA